ncbi:hypothetical protein GF327_02990 [Candidatus Woesearchaeota archaeon]|nr:hypothetical protein [Candidatus Woesearchaeota archaeon]
MARSYMEYGRNFFFNLKNYGLKLKQSEIKGSIATILILAFVFSFREWGDETFDFVAGIVNYFISVVLVAIALFFNQLGQRIIAVYYGYDPEYKYSMIGLMMAMVVAFASRGLFIVALPGQIVLNMLTASRLGEFRYYTNLWEIGKSQFGAPYANFLVACIASFFQSNPIFHKLMTINILFAIYSLVPFPGNPGMHLFFNINKYLWGFAVGFTVGGVLLLLFTNGIIAFFGSSILGLIAFFVYFQVIDKNLG